MEQFKNKAERFNEIRNTALIKVVPLMLIVVAGGVMFGEFSAGGQQSEVNILPVFLPFMLLALTLGLYLGIKRQKGIFESYKLTIDEKGIMREQMNTPTVNITVFEITKIIKNKNGSFLIKGNSSVNIILIFPQIEDYDRVEQLLTEMHPITSITDVPLIQKFQIPIVLLILGCMFAVYTTQNKVVVGFCGTIFLITMIYSFIEIRKSKNIDQKTKNISWLTIMVVLSVIGIMYVKLTR